MSEHWSVAIIREYENEKFYGAVVLRFRDGKVTLIEEQRTILPPTEDIPSKDPVRIV